MGVRGVFHYVECDGCRTVYQNPRVRDEDLALCYPADYFTHVGPPWTPSPAPVKSLRDRLRRAIRAAADGVPDEHLSPGLRVMGWLLSRHTGLRWRARLGLVDGLEVSPGDHGRCLEVGPGQGVDLFCLRTLGWEAQGLDVDPVAAERARTTSGCEVRVGTLESVPYLPAHFDLVYMSHVVEHLPDPARALARCAELLAPGGRVVLVFPNPAALTVQLFGRFSCVFEPPRHLVLPPVQAAASLLEKVGFFEVQVSTSARHAATYLSASRTQRGGAAWDWRRPRPPAPGDRLLGVLEGLLVALGLPVGEEVVLRARKPH